jgi:hypothetical protein
VVFAHAKHVQAHSVGGFDAFEQVLNGFNGLLVFARGEAVDSKFHGFGELGVQKVEFQRLSNPKIQVLIEVKRVGVDEQKPAEHGAGEVHLTASGPRKQGFVVKLAHPNHKAIFSGGTVYVDPYAHGVAHHKNEAAHHLFFDDGQVV